MDKRIMHHLFETAVSVPRVGSGKLAAAVVYKGQIVSVGVNSLKTHPLQKKYASNPDRIFLHAEMSALVRASRLLFENEFKRSSLYIARARKVDGEYCTGLAQPCSGCVSAIAAFGIKSVYFTDNCDYPVMNVEDIWALEL